LTYVALFLALRRIVCCFEVWMGTYGHILTLSEGGALRT
jgi:hypothetical protein